MNDFVSIIIPAYNAEWCIAKAVESVLSQTYNNYEILVVDDGSTDDTVQILKRYSERIKIIQQTNKGLSSARNSGFHNATADLIAFLDADDYWLQNKLERQVSLMDKHKDIGFCSTAAYIESLDGSRVGEWKCPQLEKSVLHTIFYNTASITGSGSSVMVRRDVLNRTGLFDESLKSLEDLDMWMRVAAVTDYMCIEEPLAVITKNNEGSLSANLDRMRHSALKVMRKNRHLLDSKARGGFWQASYAGVLADYAKWEYRNGQRTSAIIHLIEGFLRSPIRRGRLTIGLLIAAIIGRLK